LAGLVAALVEALRQGVARLPGASAARLAAATTQAELAALQATPARLARPETSGRLALVAVEAVAEQTLASVGLVDFLAAGAAGADRLAPAQARPVVQEAVALSSLLRHDQRKHISAHFLQQIHFWKRAELVKTIVGADD
jgi:hypothetical protein